MDYYIRFVDLPAGIKGITVLKKDFYSVYINAGLSSEEQQKAIKHELTHIKREDFYSDAAIEEIENL